MSITTILDSKFFELLSDFFLDIAKAFFIAGFVNFADFTSWGILFFLLIRSLLGTTIFLYFSWKFDKLGGAL